MPRHVGTKSGKNEEKPGCGIAFGLGWMAFSSIFVVVGLWQVWRAVEARGWDEVPCVVERFAIVAERDGTPPFRPDLRFRYVVDGVERESTRLWADKEGVDEYEELAEVRERVLRGPEGRLPEDAEVAASCRVNPANPE